MVKSKWQWCAVCGAKYRANQLDCDHCLMMDPYERAAMIAFNSTEAGFTIVEVKAILKQVYGYGLKEITFAMRQLNRPIA